MDVIESKNDPKPLKIIFLRWITVPVRGIKVPDAGCLLAVEEGRARADQFTGEALRDWLQANSLV